MAIETINFKLEQLQKHYQSLQLKNLTSYTPLLQNEK